MALDNALVYRPFGAAIVQVGTGANNALETLGTTVSGVDVVEEWSYEPIMTDVAGPINPGEFQKFGQKITLKAEMIIWNPTIWEKVQKRQANGTTAGVLGPSGSLVMTGGYTVRAALVSADTLEDPYYVPVCVVKTPTSRRKSSKHNPIIIEFTGLGLHLATATSLANTTIWSRTLPP